MATVLLILKIILRVFLVIVFSILVLIALLLFFPWQYRVKIDGSEDRQYSVKATIYWLFHVLHISIQKRFGGEEDQELKLSIRLFGIPLKKRKRKKNTAEGEEPDSESQIQDTADASEETPDSSKEGILNTSEEGTQDSPEDGAPDNSEEGPPDSSKEGALGPENPEIHGPGRKSSKSEKGEIPEPEKPEGAFGKLKKAIKILTDEKNKPTFTTIIEALKKLIGHIKPRRFKAHVIYSLGDPANTGKLTGIFAMLPFIYERGNRIIPDFEAEKAYFKGKISIQGRIILIVPVVAVIRLLLDKNVRKLIKQIKG